MLVIDWTAHRQDRKFNGLKQIGRRQTARRVEWAVWAAWGGMEHVRSGNARYCQTLNV